MNRKTLIALIIFIAFIAGGTLLLIKYTPEEIVKLSSSLITGSRGKTSVAAPGEPPAGQSSSIGSAGTWTEVTSKRNRTSRTYRNAETNKFSWDGSMTPISYESVPDSGKYDTPIDMTPVRVNNTSLDGWLINQNDWHYALGKPSDKTTDGWVGFGGRNGENWFKFRLARVGYLHWPTRAWNDIGGAPTYNRTNLTSQVNNLTLGPNNEQLPVESVTTWKNLWTTPGNGSLDISWRVNGNELKEEVTINQAGRAWIKNNRSPATPLNETWFGFVFQLDWSNIPKIVRDNIKQNTSGDFSDDGKNIELKDNLDRLLAFLPLSDVWVVDANGNEIPGSRTQLRKRFYNDGTNTYLLVGLRADTVAAMPDGNLVFDPTVDYQVGTSTANDGYYYSSTLSNNDIYEYIGQISTYPSHAYLLFPGVTVPNGATITTAYLSGYAGSVGGVATNVRTVISMNDADNATVPTSAANGATKVRTTGVEWDPSAWNVGIWYNSPSLVSDVSTVTSRAGWSSGNSMMVLHDDNGSAPANNFMRYYDYTNNPSLTAKLHIEYLPNTGVVFICGAECGITTPGSIAGQGHWDWVVGTPTIETTIVHSGSRSYKFGATGTGMGMQRYLNASTRHLVGRAYIYWPSGQSVWTWIFWFDNTSGMPAIYIDNSNVLGVYVGSGVAQTYGTIPTNQWVMIEWNIDTSGATATMDWRVNGVAQTQATYAQAAADITELEMGIGSDVTATMYVDDIIMSTSASDYPFGAGSVLPMLAASDGTHSFNVGDFKYNNSSNVAVAATNVYTYIDTVLGTDTSDFISQNVSNASGYVEVGFAAAPSNNYINGVMLVSSHHSAGTNSNTCSLKANDNGTIASIYTNQDVSGTGAAINYLDGVLNAKPSGGAWTTSALNSLKARWGYSNDVVSIPYLDGLMLEVDFSALSGPTPTPTPTPTTGPASSNSLKFEGVKMNGVKIN